MKNTQSPTFYDDDYIPYQSSANPAAVDLNNPFEIYKFLTQNVYKQDEYCKRAAMLLFNHIKGVTSRMVVCGPPGSGKTLVAECIKKIWPKTIIVNSATLTKDGWSGDNKTTSFLDMVDPSDPNYIICFDEFDKLVHPQYTSHGENVAESMQSEFLKLIEGEIVQKKGRNDRDDGRVFDTSRMSFIFAGSFAIKADEIARSNCSKAIGFTGVEHVEKAYDKELTLDDIIDFGMIPEIASRCTHIVNVNPLTLKDYEYLLTDHSASPLKKIEEEYQVKIKITKKKLREIAKLAHESNLGVRYATSYLRRLVDAEIFASFENNGGDLAFIKL